MASQFAHSEMVFFLSFPQHEILHQPKYINFYTPQFFLISEQKESCISLKKTSAKSNFEIRREKPCSFLCLFLSSGENKSASRQQRIHSAPTLNSVLAA